MKLSENTVLITGGASGIGFALAERFIKAGSRVIICDRFREQLEKARRQLPEISAIECDVSSEAGRLSLFSRVTKKFPKFNVLINNAGVQNHPPALIEVQDWDKHRQEIATNLDAPMHLSMMFIPHLQKQDAAAIVNMSSALAFSPFAMMPTFCATKAALHSFTLSLRHQLKETSIDVFEVVPPKLNDQSGFEKLADDMMKRLAKGESEFGFGDAETARTASRAQLDRLFVEMNA